MTIAGEWDVKVKTPIGSLATVYAFSAGPGGLAGTATYKDETVALQNITAEGQRVTWRQSVTKPMRLNLNFDVLVDGDTLTGHSRAGRLPRSEVAGRRRYPAP